MQIMLPQKPREAIVVRMGGISPMGNMPGANRAAPPRRRDAAAKARGAPAGRRGGLQIFIDPVSGEVLGTRKAVLPAFPDLRPSAARQFPDGPRTGRTWLSAGWAWRCACWA